MKVCVVGQGYVGLPLSLAIAQSGREVIGIDSNSELVTNLNHGISPFAELSSHTINELVSRGLYSVTTSYSAIKECDVVVICVPTPLGFENKPDLSIVLEVTSSLANLIDEKTLIIYESTVATGTIREQVIPLLSSISGINPDNLKIAYSPERIDPLNLKWNVANTPKLVSGITQQVCHEALKFYSRFIDNIVECTSIEIAETAKLLENSFRLVNISFINELAIFCNKIGIDINEVIKVAATKPYGFMPFFPSLGVGGHCIPVDPIYLSDKAKQVGTPLTLIDKANQINNEIPSYYIGRADEKIGGINGKKLIILGLAYKPNISDTRESPVEPLINGLRDKGAIVHWHDDLVGEWNGEKSVALGANYDLAILATSHDYFDLSKLGNVPILDTHGSL